MSKLPCSSPIGLTSLYLEAHYGLPPSAFDNHLPCYTNAYTPLPTRLSSKPM